MLRHRYGSPTAFAVSCLGKEKNKIVKIFGFSLSTGIELSFGIEPSRLHEKCPTTLCCRAFSIVLKYDINPIARQPWLPTAALGGFWLQ